MEPSAGFNSNVVIYGFAEPLLAAQIFFGGLHRDVPQKELNLFQLASRIVTEASARPPEIVRREF